MEYLSICLCHLNHHLLILYFFNFLLFNRNFLILQILLNISQFVYINFCYYYNKKIKNIVFILDMKIQIHVSFNQTEEISLEKVILH